jgi:hypothetical protein
MNVFQIDKAFNYETVTEKQQIRIGREMRAESAQWTLARQRNRSSGSRFPITHNSKFYAQGGKK